MPRVETFPAQVTSAVSSLNRTLLIFPRVIFANTSATVGASITIFMVFVSVMAPWLSPADPLALSNQVMHAPMMSHPLGTDDLGRDVLSRVFYGGRTSLTVGFCSAFLAVVLGTVVGMTAGYAGGRIDDVIMRITEAFQIVPRILLAIVVISLMGGGLAKIIGVIGILGWTGTARIVRAQVLTLRGEEFVLAATLAGASPARVVVRHILPNIIPFIIVSASLQAGAAILIESLLSFLGLGNQDYPSWGLLLQQAQPYLRQAWWLSTFPGLALALTILGLNLFGDGLASLISRKGRL